MTVRSHDVFFLVRGHHKTQECTLPSASVVANELHLETDRFCSLVILLFPCDVFSQLGESFLDGIVSLVEF